MMGRMITADFGASIRDNADVHIPIVEYSPLFRVSVYEELEHERLPDANRQNLLGRVEIAG